MKKIILSLLFLPVFANAGFCKDYAQSLVLAAYWKLDGVPEEVSINRTQYLYENSYVFNDMEGEKQSEFTEVVKKVYQDNGLKLPKAGDSKGMRDYMSNVLAREAVLLIACKAYHSEPMDD